MAKKSQFEMRKEKEEAEKRRIVEEEAAAIEALKPDFNRQAYDVFFDTDMKKYVKVTVEYCTRTGFARVKEVIGIADSQPVASYKIQELFAKKIIGIKSKENK